MTAPSIKLVFGTSVVALIFSAIALGFSIFGLPGSSLGKADTDMGGVFRAKVESAPEPPPEPVVPMPPTMNNPTVEDLHRLARTGGEVAFFAYYMQSGDFPLSLAVDYTGRGFTRIDLDGLNNSHLYFQLSEALKATGRLK